MYIRIYLQFFHSVFRKIFGCCKNTHQVRVNYRYNIYIVYFLFQALHASDRGEDTNNPPLPSNTTTQVASHCPNTKNTNRGSVHIQNIMLPPPGSPPVPHRVSFQPLASVLLSITTAESVRCCDSSMACRTLTAPIADVFPAGRVLFPAFCSSSTRPFAALSRQQQQPRSRGAATTSSLAVCSGGVRGTSRRRRWVHRSWLLCSGRLEGVLSVETCKQAMYTRVLLPLL